LNAKLKCFCLLIGVKTQSRLDDDHLPGLILSDLQFAQRSWRQATAKQSLGALVQCAWQGTFPCRYQFIPVNSYNNLLCIMQTAWSCITRHIKYLSLASSNKIIAQVASNYLNISFKSELGS
jgi:hypothetical protein